MPKAFQAEGRKIWLSSMLCMQTGMRSMEALYIEVALIYLLFCTVLTKVQAVCEKKLSAYGF